MIEGEIYTLTSGTIFAYKAIDGTYIYHYICVNDAGEVRVKNVNGTGRLGRCRACLATTDQRAKFFRRIHEAGFHYNQANKVVIHNNQIVEQ
jgi:hypothetical protein